jgi:hypothetical protein
VFPDISVRHSGGNEWTGISRDAAVAGETWVLDVIRDDAPDGDPRERLSASVIESRPILIEGGDMYYRIRLNSGGLALVHFDRQVRRG